MKKLLILAIIATSLFAFNSCKKDSAEEKQTETTNPATPPDLTTQTNATVAGFISDENGTAVSGAAITAGTSTATTDARGYFKIINATLIKTAGLVKVVKTGYFTGYKTFLPQTGKETFIRLQLIAKTITGTISSNTGGMVTMPDGANITLPADAVVVAAGGTAYTGVVNVAAHWYNPADVTTLENMPGDLRGIDESGVLKSLITYGMLNVELTGSNGELLQMASGKQASLQIPIPSALQSSAPVTIPMWYCDESNGLWKQDGNGTKSGTNYEATVSHFTTWNWDQPYTPVTLSGQFVNNADQPIINIPVLISINGTSNTTTMVYTDPDGNFFVNVPANMEMLVQVLDQCGIVVFSQTVTMGSNNLDMGMLLINPPTGFANVNGSVVDCNNAPVNNGIVFFTNSNGLCQVATVQNGTFNINMLYCDNPTSYFAINLDNNEQSSSQQVNLVSGNNNLGTLTACSTGTGAFIELTVNGVPQIMELPDMANSDIGPQFENDPGSSSIIHANSADGRVLAQISFRGPVGTGVKDGQSGVVLSSGTNYAYSNGTNTGPWTINITEYGPVGGYISGNFSSDRWYQYANSNSPFYNIQYSFRLLRNL